MKITKPLFFAALLTMAFIACKQTEFKKTKDGYAYKVFSAGSGDKIEQGFFVSLHRTTKIKDSVLETTYGNAPQILPIPKDSSIRENELAQILLGARKGDSVQINQPVDSILNQNPQAGQDPFLTANRGQSIVYTFKVVDVYKTQEEAVAIMEKDRISSFNQQAGIADQRKLDEAGIEQYLRANNIQAERTPWGAYVQVLSPGSGPKPKYGQFAMLRYTGRDLSGKVFDATEKHGGQLLPLQIGAGRSIPGFEDGVKQLSKGAKAIIYIPSVVGYGQSGTPADPQTREQAIKPNQNLVFEVEVVDIADQPTQSPAPPSADTSRR
jgi:FKBP-type peptidyl-prolyl cis-trans isomerase